MKRLEKAIAYFEDAIRESDEIIAECSEELQEELTEQKEHFVVALDAMWRNIPAPVVKAGIYGVGESCPHCKSEVKGMYFYCTVCGQKLTEAGEGKGVEP